MGLNDASYSLIISCLRARDKTGTGADTAWILRLISLHYATNTQMLFKLINAK